MREMKDSGIAWLGAIPNDYTTAPIGSLFTIKKDIIGHEPETVLSITQTGVKPKDLSSNEGQNASSYAHYQKVSIGDFAMNHMDLLTGWVDISKYEGVTSPDYRVFCLNDKSHSADFFLRVFQYYYANKVFFGFGQGVATLGRWRLPAVNFQKIDVPVPPQDEQERIIQAINDKVEKIENLKRNVNEQIEKLKLYKQSMITEVVTRGLDPFVPMKDSGSIWIGKIPTHWKMNRIKFCSTYNDETLSEKEDENMVIDYVDIGSVSLSEGVFRTEQFRFLDAPSRARRITKSGDIIVSTVRTYLKAIAAIKQDGLIVSTGFCVLRPNGIINNRYMEYFCKSDSFTNTVSANSYGISYPAINATSLVAFQIIVPTEKEQLQIAEFLDDKCYRIDSLIRIKERKIEKLEQYKKSLIYEYITGKKEVL